MKIEFLFTGKQSPNASSALLQFVMACEENLYSENGLNIHGVDKILEKCNNSIILCACCEVGLGFPIDNTVIFMECPEVLVLQLVEKCIKEDYLIPTDRNHYGRFNHVIADCKGTKAELDDTRAKLKECQDIIAHLKGKLSTMKEMWAFIQQ